MLVKIKLSRFYSAGDEMRLFEGFKAVPAVRGVRGEGRDLLLDIRLKDLTSDAVRELVALLFRYKISLSPLRFLSERKKFEWLNNEKGFWYKSMFKDA
jgi:hypothetical protein